MGTYSDVLPSWMGSSKGSPQSRASAASVRPGSYVPAPLPMAVREVELSLDPLPDFQHLERYSAARVLVRLHGVPVGSIEVPVRGGRVRSEEMRRMAVDHLAPAIARELLRRLMLTTGLPPRLEPQSVCHSGRPKADRPLSVTVIICTRNRTADLGDCLESLRALSYPDVEVLVVDNAPTTEDTRKLVQTRFPDFRYVRENTPGLDNARNRGIRESKGDVLAFTDDDVRVDAGWVTALVEVFSNAPEVGLVTGLVEPYELETEAQVLFETYGGFGRGYRQRFTQGLAGQPVHWSKIGAGELGAGANMAIRRNLLGKTGAFDPALDVGTPSRGGGDHDIFFRMIKSGASCVYEPAALVWHRHRQTIDALRRLMYDYGYGTRCFLEREAETFPEDAVAVGKLIRWWWVNWGLARWLRSFWRPAAFPRELVTAELIGFFKGRGAYHRARAAVETSSETDPVDAFSVPQRSATTGHSPTVGVEVVDVSKPLQTLVGGRRFDELEVLVQWRGQPLGAVRMASRREALRAYEVAAQIAAALWPELLQPASQRNPRFEHGAFFSFKETLARWLRVDGLPPDMPMVRGSASIVVATCNRPQALRRCLESLTHLNTARVLEIIVVDNHPGSSETASAIADFSGVRVLEELRKGSAYARNAGIAAARGDFIAITDDDMVVTPEWLEHLLQPFSDPQVLAVTGNTLPASLETPAERLFEDYGGFSRGSCLKIADRAWFHSFRRRAVPTWTLGGSGNMACRTELFARRDIGPMHEALGAGVPTGVGEDTLLFYDILHAGYTIVYQPKAIAWHYHRISNSGLRQQLYDYSKGHVAYHLLTFGKHRDGRALGRLAIELPRSCAWRAAQRVRGKTRYPLYLLWIEMAGYLAGPIALWRSCRLLRQRGPGARRQGPSVGGGEGQLDAVAVPGSVS